MKNWIVFNHKSLKDFGVFISGSGTYNAPERDVTAMEIPGRNGNLTIDNGRYKNISLTYPAFVMDGLSENVQALRNFLLSQKGYLRLEDTYHPDEFRLARWDGDFITNPHDALYAGEFTLKFDCCPQRYLKSGENPIELTAGATIQNENLVPALPLIRAYGTGSFSINGIAVQITSANSFTDIDCELQEAYKDTLATNCNGNIVLTNGFPSLDPGANVITLTNLTKLEITPRWWRL